MRHRRIRESSPRVPEPIPRFIGLLQAGPADLDARRRSARVMLLGEAPSHRGARFTEVELVHKAGLVASEPLPLTSADAATKPVRERSAAIIWDELERAGCSREVVLWNAFPWHPCRAPAEAGSATIGPCGPSSNRKPRQKEVEQGHAPLKALLACFTHPLPIFAMALLA